MVKKITAIRAYRPELRRMRTMQTEALMEQLVQRTSLSQGAVFQVIYELRDTLLMAHRTGQAVKVEGLGTFTPTIRATGKLDVLFRPDARLLDDLNSGNLYTTIVNKDSIGKSAETLVTRWNLEHPDDPVEE